MSTQMRLEGPDANGVAIVWIDQPNSPVNVLNTDSIPEFTELLSKIQADHSIKALVIASGKDHNFIAGADIKMLNTVTSIAAGVAISKKGQDAMNQLAKFPIPTVAAIHGSCLGGGLELAMACTARIASESPKTVMALPEVMLGLLPGAGGTRRLPKLVGLTNALPMMLTGKNIRPHSALKMGLVNQVSPKVWLIRDAKALALSLIAKRKLTKPKKNTMEQLMEWVSGFQMGKDYILDQAKKQVLSQTKGLYPAPLKIIEVLRKDTDAAEAQGFGELLMTSESQGLRHIFHCKTKLGKDDGDGTTDVEPYPIEHIGILGAGLMGGGIATVLVDKQFTVRMKDINYEGVQFAMNYASEFFSKAVKRKRYPASGKDERMNRLSGGLDFEGFSTADVIIEAVPEVLALKQDMLRQIEELTKTGAIFASNTSSLPITEIAQYAAHPERVIGMHFFSPVEKMNLVEVIVTAKTDPKVTKTISQLSRKMGKDVIVVNDCAGFYTTRALVPYLSEAIFLLLGGYDVAEIDLAATEAGFFVGPLTLLDEVGIDVGAKIIKIMKEHYGDRMELPDAATTDVFVNEGRLGRKSNKGFYVYEKNKSKMEKGQKIVDAGIYKHLPKMEGEYQSNKASRRFLANRLKLAFINEAVLCLEEGILRDPESGDLGAVFGLGFIPFSGGPFKYIDLMGVDKFVFELDDHAAKFGRRFQPGALLKELVERKMGLYEYWNQKEKVKSDVISEGDAKSEPETAASEQSTSETAELEDVAQDTAKKSKGKKSSKRSSSTSED